MSEEDFDDDLQQIMDDLDDDLVGKKRTEKQDGRPGAATNQTARGTGKTVKFEEKEEPAGKPVSKKLNFDDKSDLMDDLFGSSKKEGKSSFLDDILGETSPQKKNQTDKKEGKSSFLDDILGETSPQKKELSNKKDFVLDDKYKKSEKDFSFGDLGQSRRRRGNPTIGNAKPEIKDDIFTDTPKTEVVPNEVKSNTNISTNISTTTSTSTTANTPAAAFPWMTNTSGGFQQTPAENQTTALPQPKPQLSQPLPVKHSNPSSLPAPPAQTLSQGQSSLPVGVETPELSLHLQTLYANQNKVNQAHAEQSQQLLERVQQQFEEEVTTRQKMFMDQLEMMTKIQRDIPHQNVLEFFTNFPGGRKEMIDEKMKGMMEEKITDIECIFRVKEEKMKENYEIIIKDLENKLGNYLSY